MKSNTKKYHRETDACDKVLRRLTKEKETASQIYELAESFYFRDGSERRMTNSDIEQITKYLQQTENDTKRMKKQFQDLAMMEGGFVSEKIPVGF